MTFHYDPSAFTSQAAVNGFDAGTNDNFLADCEATIQESWARARYASRESLEHLRQIGERLNEAKQALAGTSQGAFGRWCDACQFPFQKQWRARLMKLAAHWDAIIKVVEAEPDDRKTWSLDGVLSLWNAGEKARKQAEAAANGEGDAAPKAKRETEADCLRRTLEEALERIAKLEADLAAERAGKAKGGAKAEQPKQEAPKREVPKGEAPKVDPVTRQRAAKAWALYQRPGTEGEREAALSRLKLMADRFGLSFKDFCAACGLA